MTMHNAALAQLAEVYRANPSMLIALQGENPGLFHALMQSAPDLVGLLRMVQTGARSTARVFAKPAGAAMQHVATPIQGGAMLGPWKTDDLGPPWLRVPIFPTAPFVPNRKDVARQVRFYSTGIVSTEADYAIGSEATRSVQFDLPCKLVAITGSAFNTAAGNALPAGVGPRDCWQIMIQYNQGDNLTTASRIASTVIGESGAPGEIGAEGWTIQGGGALIIGVTPLLASLQIDITFHCIEMRGPTNVRRG